MTKALIDEGITREVISAFFEVFNKLGYGFLEHIYVAALDIELRDRRCRVGREVQVRVHYKGIEVGLHRLDMLVNERVIVEVKAGAALPRNATSQVYNYLRASRLDVGMLLHFGHEPKFYRCLNPLVSRLAVPAVPE